MNRKFEPLIPYVTYNKKEVFLYSLLINRFSFLSFGMLYALNFYFNIISYFSSSIAFFIISILLFIKDMIDNQNMKLAAIEGFKIFILIHLINQERLINFIEPISEKELLIIHELLNEINKKNSICVNVNIRMYNFDDVQCTVIPSVAYGFVTGMNLQLC